MIDTLVFYFILFIMFSIIGYICEVIDVLIVNKELVNRGFMHGPYIPIYGFGSIFTVLFLNKYYSDPIIVFFMGMIICTVLEYVVSHFMEKIFHRRWWDYSDYKYNLNGRVCLTNVILFGIGCLAIIYGLNPFFNSVIGKINNLTLYIIAGICFIVFITDYIISFNEAWKTSFNITGLEKITKSIEKTTTIKIKKVKIRLLNAYPNLVKNNKELIDKIKKYKKEISRKFNK